MKDEHPPAVCTYSCMASLCWVLFQGIPCSQAVSGVMQGPAYSRHRLPGETEPTEQAKEILILQRRSLRADTVGSDGGSSRREVRESKDTHGCGAMHGMFSRWERGQQVSQALDRAPFLTGNISFPRKIPSLKNTKKFISILNPIPVSREKETHQFQLGAPIVRGPDVLQTFETLWCFYSPHNSFERTEALL